MRSSEKLREHNSLRGLLGVPTTDVSEYAHHGGNEGGTNLHTAGGAEATKVEAGVDVNCAENE